MPLNELPLAGFQVSGDKGPRAEIIARDQALESDNLVPRVGVVSASDSSHRTGRPVSSRDRDEPASCAAAAAAVKVQEPVTANLESEAMRVPTLPRESFKLVVCPDAHEKHEFYGDTPPRMNCSKCGQNYISGCSNCKKPYNATDYDADYHNCRAKIPWAEARNKSIEVPPLMRELTDSPDNMVVLSRALQNVRRAQDEKVETPLRKLVSGVARFFGHSVNKGVENAIARVVEYGLLALLIVVLLRFGLNVSSLQ